MRPTRSPPRLGQTLPAAAPPLSRVGPEQSRVGAAGRRRASLPPPATGSWCRRSCRSPPRRHDTAHRPSPQSPPVDVAPPELGRCLVPTEGPPLECRPQLPREAEALLRGSLLPCRARSCEPSQVRGSPLRPSPKWSGLSPASPPRLLLGAVERPS